MQLQTLEKWLLRLVNIITAVVTGCIVLLVLSQVVFRYILTLSVPWTEELARTLYIWIVFVAVILVEREDSHIRTTLVIDMLSPGVRLVWETIMYVFSIIFNLCIFIGAVIEVGTISTFLGSLPWMSQKIMYYPILFAAPIMIMYQIVHLVRQYQKFLTSRIEGEKI